MSYFCALLSHATADVTEASHSNEPVYEEFSSKRRKIHFGSFQNNEDFIAIFSPFNKESKILWCIFRIL